MRSWSSVLFMAALSVCAPALARAQEAPDPGGASSVARARALFGSAREHMRGGRIHDARRDLEQALALHAAPTIHWNLAACEHELGRPLEAIAHLREVERTSGVEPSLAERARALAAELEERLAHLTVVVRGVEDAELSLDGAALPRSALGIPRRLNPGFHVLIAAAPNHRRFRAELELVAGERRTLDVEIEPTSPVPFPDFVAAAVEAEVFDAPPLREVLSRPGDADSFQIAEQWWFWTGIGAVVLAIAGGTMAAFLVSEPDALPLPNAPIETRGD